MSKRSPAEDTIYDELTVQMAELDAACEWQVMGDRCSETARRARYYWRALAKKRFLMSKLSAGVPKYMRLSDAMADD
jgi:hypothetical protein